MFHTLTVGSLHRLYEHDVVENLPSCSCSQGTKLSATLPTSSSYSSVSSSQLQLSSCDILSLHPGSSIFELGEWGEGGGGSQPSQPPHCTLHGPKQAGSKAHIPLVGWLTYTHASCLGWSSWTASKICLPFQIQLQQKRGEGIVGHSWAQLNKKGTFVDRQSLTLA